MAKKGGRTLEKVNNEITQELLERDDQESYTLIIDPTIIEAQKREAKMTYLGVKGYRPVVATLKETPVAICYEFKEGNDNGGRLEIVKRALSKIPRGKKIKLIILDSEYYCSDVIEYLEGEKMP